MKKHLIFLLGALCLAACSGPAGRLWLNAPGWSRAQWVGTAQIPDPVSIALDEAGTVYLLLVGGEDEALQLQVLALDRQARVVWQQKLDQALSQPDKPLLFWDGRELQLFWLSDRRLFQARLDNSGRVVSPPQVLSGDYRVESYHVAVNARGQAAVWFATARREPGLYALPLGELDGEVVVVDEAGIRPVLRFDDEGTLNAIWAHYPQGFGQTRFYYAAYPEGVFQPGQKTAVAEFSVNVTSQLDGPWLGLDHEQAYLFWNISVRTGAAAGSVSTNYVAFPLGRPALNRPQLLRVPAEADLPYEEAAGGGLLAGPRVLLESYGEGSTTPASLFPNPAAAGELALAVQVQARYQWNKVASQAGLLFLEQGVPASYQLLSFTSSATTAPAVLSDPAGYLYATWLEPGGSGFTIYFASTAPDLRQALRSLSGDDVGRLAAETLFGLLTGALLAPIAVSLWLILPGVLLLLTSVLRRREEKLTGPGTLVSVALAVAAFWVVKVASIPGLLAYAPFSAWLHLPGWMQLPLQIIVPLAIMIGAIVTAWHFTYRRDVNSLLYFILLYGAVDGLLTMAVYGVLVYGAL